MSKFVFIGSAHFPNDPRLYYRTIYNLKKHTDCTVYWINTRKDVHFEKLDYIDHFFTCGNIVSLLKKLIKIRPDFVQVSDPREVIYFFAAKLLTNAKVVYDSHEDYKGLAGIALHKKKSVVNYLVYYSINFIEYLISKKADFVFCTDQNIYSKLRRFNARTHVVHNFVETDWLPPAISSKSEHLDKQLKLLYIGSYNPFRGVRETIENVIRFNNDRKNRELKLSFHIYTRRDRLPFKKHEIDDFLKQGVFFHDYIPLESLYRVVGNYDVGTCIWLDIPKHRTNAPIKNFEYMALGLPLITSDFGLMKYYADKSGTGYCIDPTSYEQFFRAMIFYSDPENIKKSSIRGIEFTEDHNFYKEFQNSYLQILDN